LPTCLIVLSHISCRSAGDDRAPVSDGQRREFSGHNSAFILLNIFSYQNLYVQIYVAL